VGPPPLGFSGCVELMCLVCEGRRRTEKNKEEEDEAKRRVESILESVRERGIFKTRKPEGKAGDH